MTALPLKGISVKVSLSPKDRRLTCVQNGDAFQVRAQDHLTLRPDSTSGGREGCLVSFWTNQSGVDLPWFVNPKEALLLSQGPFGDGNPGG